MAEDDLVKRIADIEQALIGVYSILGEDVNHRNKLIRFLKGISEEDTDEKWRSFVSRFEQSQGSKASLFKVLFSALHSSIPPPPRGRYDG